MGASHDKPSALQFKYRLKWYILGKHSTDMLIEKCNIEEDEDTTLIDMQDAQDVQQNLISINRAMDTIMGSLYDEEVGGGMQEADMSVSSVYNVDDETGT